MSVSEPQGLMWRCEKCSGLTFNHHTNCAACGAVRPAPPEPEVNEPPRLDQLDANEWWDVCQRVRPDISRRQFDQSWAEFLAVQQRKLEH